MSGRPAAARAIAGSPAFPPIGPGTAAVPAVVRRMVSCFRMVSSRSLTYVIALGLRLLNVEFAVCSCRARQKEGCSQ